MARPKRGPISIGTFFITANTWGRRALFLTESLGRLFLDVLYHDRNKARYKLHEFTLMPEHFHLIVTPGENTSLERMGQWIKGGFSYRVGTDLLNPMEIWQPGFADHHIRDARNDEIYRTSIFQNAVQRGLAERAEDYKYGSAHWGFDLDPVLENLGG